MSVLVAQVQVLDVVVNRAMIQALRGLQTGQQCDGRQGRPLLARSLAAPDRILSDWCGLGPNGVALTGCIVGVGHWSTTYGKVTKLRITPKGEKVLRLIDESGLPI